jgi:hypothetical protein
MFKKKLTRLILIKKDKEKSLFPLDPEKGSVEADIYMKVSHDMCTKKIPFSSRSRAGSVAADIYIKVSHDMCTDVI